jgi:hypothetical protein
MLGPCPIASRPARTSVSAYTLAVSGRTQEARDLLAMLEQRARERYVPPCAFALVHAGLNDEASVYEWLERACEVRDVHSPALKRGAVREFDRGDR